jgi:hypothetical protein
MFVSWVILHATLVHRMDSADLFKLFGMHQPEADFSCSLAQRERIGSPSAVC